MAKSSSRQGLATRQETVTVESSLAPGQEYIAIAKIRADGGTQMRAGLNEETVAEYAEWLRDLAHIRNGLLKMPPIIVYHDGTDYWLADGFHRLAAWKLRGELPTAIHAIVHAGDRRAAILHAAGANAEHGLRRTSADKRRAVETLLKDEEWRIWSDAEIGRNCHVDPKTVGNIRRELEGNREIPDSPMRKRADGAIVNTANVGANQPKRSSPIGFPVPAQEVDEIEEELSDEERAQRAPAMAMVEREREEEEQERLGIEEAKQPRPWEDTRTASEKRISWLTNCPAHDINFRSNLEDATIEELKAALVVFEGRPEKGNKTAREKIGARLRRLEKEATLERALNYDPRQDWEIGHAIFANREDSNEEEPAPAPLDFATWWAQMPKDEMGLAEWLTIFDTAKAGAKYVRELRPNTLNSASWDTVKSLSTLIHRMEQELRGEPFGPGSR